MSEYIEMEYIGSDGQGLYTGVGAELAKMGGPGWFAGNIT